MEVAPYVGAWIETGVKGMVYVSKYVAPYVGAWIETFSPSFFTCANLSHPMWVRGLKLQSCTTSPWKWKSHPMWVRGLKQFW